MSQNDPGNLEHNKALLLHSLKTAYLFLEGAANHHGTMMGDLATSLGRLSGES